MYLLDTLSHTKKYLPDGEISIYLCGPTLYNNLHLGNLRPIITFDFLIRYLKSSEIPYYYIQNLTDIDEKILKKAFEEKRDIKSITCEYLRKFTSILNHLNIILPDNLPAVSENIDEIQTIIQAFLTTKKAIWDKSEGSIKFLQEKQNKELNYFHSGDCDESDFSLWKENKITSFSYDSPWFKGIPGWHIECFAMIQKYFSLPITIHGGGIDLKFPHHENVNLLSRAAFNKEIADIWVHVGQVLNEKGKLSKSDNLEFTIEECAEQYSWSFLRYIFMKTKYSNPLVLSRGILEQYWAEWKTYLRSLNYSEIILLSNGIFRKKEFFSPDEGFIEHFKNNLNLPKILSWLEEQKQILLNCIKQKENENIHFYYSKLHYHLQWLGFYVPPLKEEDKAEAYRWLSLMEEGKYQEADIIRESLNSKDILP